MSALLRCLLMAMAATAGAADLPLGAPLRLDVHADGALLTWQVDVPAGSHRLELPYDLTAELRVSGASWSVAQETVPVDRPAPAPAALAALVGERNALCAQLAGDAGRRLAHERELQRLRSLLAATVARGSADTAAWQASLDAALAERAALDRADAEHAVAQEALLRRAEALGAGRGDWLRCAPGLPALGVAEAGRTLAQAPVATSARRVLQLGAAAPATVTITAVLHDVRWAPAATLLLSGRTARLVRQARLLKPAALALGGALPVTVTSQSLLPVLEGPQPRPVRLVAGTVTGDARRRVGQTGVAGDWANAPAAADGSAASAEPTPSSPAAQREAAAGNLADVPVARERAEMETEPGRSVRWDLGPVLLPPGEVAVVVDRPSQPVTVLADEWVVAPTLAPVALRRLGLRLDDQPLLAGPLTLVLEGTVVATQALPLHPPGAQLTLRAGEDAAVFAEAAVPWTIPAAEQGERRRRDGHTVALRNLGDAPRTVSLYQTIPVSRSAELTVRMAEATTPGFTAVQPGLLRWELTLAPGERREVALGWTLNASGGLKL